MNSACGAARAATGPVTSEAVGGVGWRTVYAHPNISGRRGAPPVLSGVKFKSSRLEGVDGRVELLCSNYSVCVCNVALCSMAFPSRFHIILRWIEVIFNLGDF